MNRLKALFEEPEELPALEHYFIVWAESGYYVVSPRTARDLLAQLRRFPRPRWVRFIDHVGAVILLRTATVQGLVESSRAQRQAERNFGRARRQEEEMDRRPEDDE